jgi:hypothetical protein
MPLLNVLRGAADLAGSIVEQGLTLSRARSPGCLIVVDTMVPMRGRTFDLQRRLVKVRLVGPPAPTIGCLNRSTPAV